MKKNIIGVRWFTSGSGTVGIVITEPSPGDRRAYIGVGLGLDQIMDTETIADYGAKIRPADLIEFLQRAFPDCLQDPPAEDLPETNQVVTGDLRSDVKIDDILTIAPSSRHEFQAIVVSVFYDSKRNETTITWKLTEGE